MPETITITTKQARRLAIIHQGLHTAAPFGKGKEGVMRAIDQTGYVQIDTISVVERAHHHVIRSRVPNYKKEYLHELQAEDRQVLEFWSHAAAYIPMNDYRFTLPIVDHFRAGKDPWPKGDPQVMQYVLDRIKAEGPLMSRDFEAPKERKGSTWWEWKPSKMALQRLFFEGELLVSHRKGFQRVYDLTERIVPRGIPTDNPTTEEYADFLIDRHLRAHAFGNASMIAYLRKGMRSIVKQRLKERHFDGELVVMDIKGLNGVELFARADLLESAGTRISSQMRILSPFDNTVIQRGRLSTVFGYDYLIECYVPKPKRVYGYFVLPLLVGDQFVGRLDAKADRKRKVLMVNALHIEDGVDEEGFLEKLVPALHKFRHFNGCETIEVMDRSRLARALEIKI